jgi:putative endonuclease
MGGSVYIMTNRRNGTLYVGTTVDLARRLWEHREGVADGFTKQYGLRLLVYTEEHDDILAAKQREMNIKHWLRAWKVRLIHQDNPDWDDLYDRLPRRRGWPGRAHGCSVERNRLFVARSIQPEIPLAGFGPWAFSPRT